MTGFYMKCNTELKRSNTDFEVEGRDALTLLYITLKNGQTYSMYGKVKV